MNETQLRGKKVLLRLIAVLLTVCVFAALIEVVSSEGNGMIERIIRVVLTAGLCKELYAGKKWARMVIIVLIGLGSLGAVLVGAGSMGTNMILAMMMLGLGVIYGGVVWSLLKSKTIREYLAYKQNEIHSKKAVV